MINLQPPEKPVRGSGDTLSVHSIFDTIQGEGPFCGRPAVFIRLAGCNLQCPLCDTDYTSGVEEWNTIDLAVRASSFGRGLIVLTGGEPFRQPIHRLVSELIERGHFVQIETNGTLRPSQNLMEHYNTRVEEQKGCYIVCSPKAGRVHSDYHKYACAFKYVLHADSVHPDDGLPIAALDHTAHPHVARPRTDFPGIVYVQPVDVQNPKENHRHLQAAIASCRMYNYVLQLQIHKIIGLE